VVFRSAVFSVSGIFAAAIPAAVVILGPVIRIQRGWQFWGLRPTCDVPETPKTKGFYAPLPLSPPVTATDMLASSLIANYVLTFPPFH